MRIVPHEDHLSAIAPSMSHRLHLALVPTGVAIDSSLPRLIKVDETKLSKTVRRILRVRSVIYTVYDSLSHRTLRIFESTGVDGTCIIQNHAGCIYTPILHPKYFEVASYHTAKRKTTQQQVEFRLF